MVSEVQDGRGSIQQRDVYKLVKEAYPNFEVVYEYPIGALSQRIDIFIPSLALAFEIHGEQHYKYNSFFFKDTVDWNVSKNLDKRKMKYLNDQGVKVIEIPYNLSFKDATQLKEYVDSIPYPEAEYTGIPTESNQAMLIKQKQKEWNKQQAEKRKQYRDKMKGKF